MICPKCKKTIPDNTLKCPYCETRTGLVCKNCNTINSVFDYECKNCGAEILKLCPNCNSVNFPNAEKCRKCGKKFETSQLTDVIDLEYPANFVTQKSAKNIIVKGILSSEKKIFSLSGEKGSGKSLVLKNIVKELTDYAWYYGKCTQITQLTPGGVLQSMLLNTLKLPDFCVYNDQFKVDAVKFFKNEFPDLTNDEASNLLNFLYPVSEGIFEDIIISKHKTFEFLNKIFKKLTSGIKFVFVIDNFDFIDGFSYEFFTRFIKKDEVFKNLKLLLLYNEPKPAKGYFYFPVSSDDNIYLDVSVAPLEFKQMRTILEQKTKKLKDFPKFTHEELKNIYQMSQGNPSFINQALLLKYDCERCEQIFELNKTFKGILEQRLALLSHLNPKAYNILAGAAIIGDKINVSLIKELFEVENKTFKKILIYLKNMNYINPVNEIFFEFSSGLLWETILKTIKDDENYENLNKMIFSKFAGITLNAHVILGVIAQNLKNSELALDIWTRITKQAAYVGDLNLYAIAQKQSLALINEFNEAETLKIRYNISERLGKLLAASNPKEAIEYLPDAISNARSVGDSPKEIELLGYLASCCRKTGNYFGEIECADSVLEKIKPENRLKTALLKSTKLNSLLNIGNCGQIINMVDNEIIPIFNEYLSKKRNLKNKKTQLVFESKIHSCLILANALVLQGNDRSFEVLNSLFAMIEKGVIQDDLFICKCKLTLAFANTIKGNFSASEQILEEILNLYRENIMDNQTIIRWNFINILNNLFRHKYKDIHQDLFRVVTFANNNGDNFTKHILKTLLGKVFKDNENSKQAMNIFNEQIAYFAKEKMALGALLTWYLIADTTLDTEGPQSALDIAQQALHVAQNPKIDNCLFMILLKTVIAKCYMTSNDYESAKIHLENAILMARKYNLKDILSRLYILYGKYFQELGFSKSAKQFEYLQSSKKLFVMAKKVIEETQNKSVHSEYKKALGVLNSYCRLNNIDLDKSTD